MKLINFLTKEEQDGLVKLKQDIQALKTRIRYKRKRRQCRGIKSSQSLQH